MIELITGLPGNSKTLYTISYVKAWAQRDKRPVYYSGISLTDEGKAVLGWTEIDPQKWMECPPTAIILIDECQRIYRNRSINTQAPKYVTDLETHRHLGVDLVFITQHPMLIDPAIRRLAGRHRHIVRLFGLDASTIHEWPQVNTNCDKPSYRKDSDKQKWVFDKSVYPLYVSAEVHTVKRRIPRRIVLVALGPVAAIVAIFVVRHYLAGHSSAKPAESSALPVAAASSPAGTFGSPVQLDPVADAKRYVLDNTPRIKGLEFTAPKYDELTKPSRVPVPAACVFNGKRCKCYSQQGTSLDVQPGECIAIVQNGYFESFDRERASNVAATPSQLRSSAAPVEASSDSSVTVLGDGSGYGVLGTMPPPASQSAGKS